MDLKDFRMPLGSTANSKRIFFNIYGLDRGGPEMRLLDFALHFPPELEIHICVTSNNLSLLRDFNKSRARINVVPIARPYLEIRSVKRVLDYIRDNHIGILNSFDLKGLTIAAAAKICYGNKITVVHHFIDLLHNYNYRTKVLLRGLVNVADCLICNTDAVRREVIGIRSPRVEVRVIHNGVDAEYFSPRPERRAVDRSSVGFDDSDFVLGTLANFRPEKNYPFLIERFRELTHTHPRLRLLCVGGGPLLDSITTVVKKYGLDRKVVFSGYVADVRYYLGMMDAFTLCSLKEGFPNALLQAMSMGLPVICSAVGECKEIITNGETGLLFDPTDAEGFLQAVSRVAEDDDLRASFSRKARELIQARFSLRQMIERYVDFYKSI